MLDLYLLLLKATLTSFSGLASLPVIRDDFVIRYHVLTDQQLNTAVAIGRTTPGAAGLYLVSIGYLVDGMAGAFVGWLALITPPLLVIPVLYYLGKKAEHPIVKRVIQAVVLSSAGLLLATSIPLALDALNSIALFCIAVISGIVLIKTKTEVIWVILGSAVLMLLSGSIQMISKLS